MEAMDRERTGSVTLALLLVGLGACATGEQWVYDKPTATSAQLDRDMIQCERLARPTGTFSYPALTGIDRDRFNTCMEGRGYRVTRAPAR